MQWLSEALTDEWPCSCTVYKLNMLAKLAALSLPSVRATSTRNRKKLMTDAQPPLSAVDESSADLTTTPQHEAPSDRANTSVHHEDKLYWGIVVDNTGPNAPTARYVIRLTTSRPASSDTTGMLTAEEAWRFCRTVGLLATRVRESYIPEAPAERFEVSASGIVKHTCLTLLESLFSSRALRASESCGMGPLLGSIISATTAPSAMRIRFT